MKPEKSKPIGILVGNLFVFVIVMGTLLTFLAVPGCDETMQMANPIIDTEPKDTMPPVMVGDMKDDPGETPAEPTATEPGESDAAKEEPTEPTPPADTTPPMVVEVAWYSDWQMTQPLTADSTVHPGDTVYTVVTFSEPVVHIVADDETARPALSVVIDGMAERYAMLPHGVGFQSGDAKPLHDGTDDYLCKYTVPADMVGTLALRVGSATADMAGNAVAEATVMAPFMVTELVAEPPPMATDPGPMEQDNPSGEYVLPSLPPGYTLPPELIPTEATVLSADEQALAHSDKSLDRDPGVPHQYTINSPADVISLLPRKDREEVYDLFVASIDLPFFAEAAEEVKEIDINIGILLGEGVRTGSWEVFDAYFWKAYEKLGISSVVLDILADAYFEENPQHLHLKGTGHSNYWTVLEYYRLQLENPRLPNLRGKNHPSLWEKEEILHLFRESAQKGHIFGLDNPWN